MVEVFARALVKELERLGARVVEGARADVPSALAHVALLRFEDALVVRDATMVEHDPLVWSPAAPSGRDGGAFFARYLVFCLARSESAALWALASSSPADPLVFLRAHDEDDDDFDAIEAEGRAWMPLSEALACAHRAEG